MTVTVLEGGQINIEKAFAVPEHNETFDRALHECTVKLLEVAADPYSFCPMEVLWVIPRDVRESLFASYNGCRLEEEVLREYIRERINHVFRLDEQEVVLFLREQIFIRRNIPIQKDKTGTERRFAGKSAEVIQEGYKEHFPKGAWVEIEPVLPDILKDRLDFTSIDNRTFIRRFIPVFRSMVEVILLEKIEALHKEDLLAFSGYVLRNHFDSILKFTANDLLGHIEQRNKNAESFIKYYNGDVKIDDEGNKVVQHAILDKYNQKWNYTAILSTLIQWKEGKNRAASQEVKLRKLMQRQEEAKAVFEKELPMKEQADGSKNSLKEKIEANRRAFKELKQVSGSSKALMQQNHATMLNMKNEDRRLIEELKALYKEHEALDKRYHNALKELQNRKKQVGMQATELKETLTQNKAIKKNYDAIVFSLASVLAKR
ncbi:MAG: hypothetical protein R3302_03355 [Sulfurimonadaceae bacterium]|nr:hypothetical protein [Sulfurimonadaceae bacterium]